MRYVLLYLLLKIQGCRHIELNVINIVGFDSWCSSLKRLRVYEYFGCAPVRHVFLSLRDSDSTKRSPFQKLFFCILFISIYDICDNI
jgi:hypothetical protein